MLVGRHGLDRATQGTDTIGRDLLESDLLDETTSFTPLYALA